MGFSYVNLYGSKLYLWRVYPSNMTLSPGLIIREKLLKQRLTFLQVKHTIAHKC